MRLSLTFPLLPRNALGGPRSKGKRLSLRPMTELIEALLHMLKQLVLGNFFYNASSTFFCNTSAWVRVNRMLV